LTARAVESFKCIRNGYNTSYKTILLAQLNFEKLQTGKIMF